MSSSESLSSPISDVFLIISLNIIVFLLNS
jgi:hypothetical protein